MVVFPPMVESLSPGMLSTGGGIVLFSGPRASSSTVESMHRLWESPAALCTHSLSLAFCVCVCVCVCSYNELKMYAKTMKKNKTFIVKPDASCQGRGIYLTRNVEEFSPSDDVVVQQYVAKVTPLSHTSPLPVV